VVDLGAATKGGCSQDWLPHVGAKSPKMSKHPRETRHNTFIGNNLHRAAKWLEQYCLPLCLVVQATLLFWRLDMLPVWGDEQFTLDTSAQPLSRIAALVRDDIHPPLYYILVHYWMELPWSAASIVKVRAFSGLWALAATLLLRRLWFRDSRFLVLLSLSPCLILYGRMGRSYTLQLFLGCLALYWGMNLIRDPRRHRWQWLYAAAGTLLLYTHYLPALAIILAVGAFLLYRRAWLALLVPGTAMILAYAPWLLAMRTAFGRVLHAEPYAVTEHPWLEQAIRLLYLPVSFTFGETLPTWVMIGGALLAPALIALAWRCARNPPEWLPLVSLAAAIAYIAAGRWVSFAFVPARLLFVLPFYLMLLARRASITAALVCLSIGSLYSYFHQEDFLNKGYLLPFDQIADIIQRDSGDRPARLIVDAPGLDVSPLTHRLPSLTKPNAAAEIVWVLSSRGRHVEPPAGSEIQRQKFVAYSKLDRQVMSLLDWKTQPSHVLELIEYRTR
jgi:hypothetical protein